jgi:hypothetical protein
MMEARIMEDDQPGKLKEVRPDKIVRSRVSQLVDGEIVVAACVPPHEIVGAEGPDLAGQRPGVSLPGDGDSGLIDENIHAVARRGQGRHDIGRDRGDSARLRRPWGKEGKAWHVAID